MKHYFQFVVLAGFLISGPLASKEVLAADPAMTAAEMQAMIKAQAAEIVQLKKERDRLNLNVKEATANVYQLEKDLAHVKEKILEKNNEIASLKKRCQ